MTSTASSDSAAAASAAAHSQPEDCASCRRVTVTVALRPRLQVVGTAGAAAAAAPPAARPRGHRTSESAARRRRVTVAVLSVAPGAPAAAAGRRRAGTGRSERTALTAACTVTASYNTGQYLYLYCTSVLYIKLYCIVDNNAQYVTKL